MEEQKPGKSFFSTVKSVYENHYKALLIIPFLLLLFSIGVIAYNIYSTGSFINKGISLKGGTSITILSSTISQNDAKALLEGAADVRTLSGAGGQVGLIIETDAITDEAVNGIKSRIKEKYSLDDSSFTVEIMGPSLGGSFFNEAMRTLAISFIFMTFVVAFYFRTFVPSIAIVVAALSDIIITIAFIDLFGIKTSTAGIAAILMLIGYSVDTDILLTIKVLKHKNGSVMERIYSAVRTGLMMTLTAITAIIIALIFSRNETISQIMTILIIGLLADIINTWIQNVGILRLYVDKKGIK
jgi:preprotein translocase subunit SecF